MTVDRRRFRSPEERVAGEVVGGEAVIIDLATGAYYNLSETATWAWQHIAAGSDLEEVAAALVRRFETTVEQARRDASHLIDELEREGLIVARESHVPSDDVPSWDGAARQPYRPPTFEAYRDLATLLALDPPAPQLAERPVVRGERDNED